MEKDNLKNNLKRLKILALVIFVVVPIISWISILFSEETVVFASLSRMIWYSGDALIIFIAVSILFIQMLISFFYSNNLYNISKPKKIICRTCIIVSCFILYIGAMHIMPSDGNEMTTENVWHGILSFGGIFMIFVTYCLYITFIYKQDKDGAFFLIFFLIFIFITGIFTVLNIFDEKSYVIASAVSELYIIVMLSITGYLTFYLAYRKKKEDYLLSLIKQNNKEIKEE